MPSGNGGVSGVPRTVWTEGTGIVVVRPGSAFSALGRVALLRVEKSICITVSAGWQNVTRLSARRTLTLSRPLGEVAEWLKAPPC